MKQKNLLVLAYLGMVVLSAVLIQTLHRLPFGEHLQSGVGGATLQRAAEVYGKLPLSFEQNQGQTDAQVKYFSRNPGYTLFLTSTEAVLALRRSQESDAGAAKPAVLRMKLVGANLNAEVSGLEELPGKTHYFVGNDPAQWRTNVPAYSQVRYQGVYPGVDLIYYGNRRQLEFDFVVAPGSDASAIELSLDGAERMDLDRQGNLVIRTRERQMVLQRPFIYQQSSGARKEISGGYVLSAAGTFRFQVGPHDPAEPLIIDPVFLLYSTYLGGLGTDEGWDIAVDPEGSVFLTGLTDSPNFPTLPFQAAARGFDAFVIKLNPKGSAAIYSTFIGGNGTDRGRGIAIDSQGNAYVTGQTVSADFPLVNPLQSDFGGGASGDAFVTKLNASGSVLLFSTYLGGIGDEAGNAIAVNPAGEVHVAGFTSSANFPTLNAFQSAFGGGAGDGFVVKLAATGNLFVYSTFLGGDQLDTPAGMALDSVGNLYVAGFTESVGFPVANAFQSVLSGPRDAFASYLNASGALVASTYFGGSGTDEGTDIAVETTGIVYITGFTNSADFPLVRALAESTGGAGQEAFVAKLNFLSATPFNAVPYSTTLGGTLSDEGRGIAADGAGFVYITGFTNSLDFPLVNAFQTAIGAGDAYVAKLNLTTDPMRLAESSYLGGLGQDIGMRIVLDAFGNAYIAGMTASSDFPTAGPFQAAFGGGVRDAFVVKVGSNPVPKLDSLSPADVLAGSGAFTLTVNGSGFVNGAIVRWNGNNRATTFVSSTRLTAAIPASDIPTPGTAQITVFNPQPGGGVSNALSFTISNPVPALSSLSPASATAGGAAFTLAVTGSNFVQGSVVRWNGAARPTSFVSGTQLTASISAADIATPGSADVTVVNPAPGGGTSPALPFTITAVVLVPAINPGGVVNGASFASGGAVAPGSIASVFGTNFAGAEAAVRMNGIAAPIFAATSTQINFQVPWELAGQTQASLVVTIDGVASAPAAVSIAPLAPGLFAADGSGQGAILIANSASVAAPVGAFPASRPAQRGEFISIFATGLGLVTSPPPTGVKASASPLSLTLTTPTVTIGGVLAEVSFSGLAPGFFGLYQVNARVPLNAPIGSSIPVVLSIGGAVSNSVTIAVASGVL